MTLSTPAAPVGPRSFWQRRLVDPIRQQLTQGTTPDKIALSLAVATSGGLFPVLGTTTGICLLAAWILRLNQPLVHLVNQLLWPAQVACILPLLRLGEWLSRAEPQNLDLAQMKTAFAAAPLAFFSDFGQVILRAILGWAVVTLVVVALVFFSLRPLLRRAASRLKTPASEMPPSSPLNP